MITIKILGLGNVQYRKLFYNLLEAVEHLGQAIEIQQVSDIEDIIRYKVPAIPALIINKTTLRADKDIPDVDEILELLEVQSDYSSKMDLKSAGE